MDTKRLLHFKVLSQTENIREAAKLLNITHAGLSKSIHTLEDELGIELITKDGRGIRLTKKGWDLIKHIQACLDAEENLIAKIRGNESLRKISIATFEVFSTYLAPILVDSLPKENNLCFFEYLPGQIEESLLSEETDFGITYLPIPKPDLDFFEIKKIEMAVYASSDLIQKTKCFSDLPFVVPLSTITETPSKAKGLDGWPDDKIPRKIKYEVTLMETALALVRSGKAAVYLPCFIANLHNLNQKEKYQIFTYPISQKINSTQKIFAIKRKNYPEDKIFKSICRVLRNLN